MKKNVNVLFCFLFVVFFCTTTNVSAQGRPPAQNVDFSPIIGSYKGGFSINGRRISANDNILLTHGPDGKMVFRMENAFSLRLPPGQLVVPIATVSLDKGVYKFFSYTVQVKVNGQMDNRMIIAGMVKGKAMTFNVYMYRGKGPVQPQEMPSEIISFAGEGLNSSIFDVSADDVKIRVSNKTVSVDGFSGMLQVFDIMGTLVYSQSVEDSTTFQLEKGIYIIKLEDKISKILIK